MKSADIQTTPLSVKEILYYFLIGLIILAVLSGIGYGIYSIIRGYNYDKSHVSTPENNARIHGEQLVKFEKLYLTKERLPAYQVATAGLKTANLTIPPLKPDELAMINYSMLAADNAGYIGPLENGVFAEEDAVRIAYRAGTRAFILRIDYLDTQKEPVLIVRNKNGDKISNNEGSIRKTIEAIAQGAPRGANADPIIVILFFQRLPNKNAYSDESMRFMMKVAESLAPLKDRHLGLTSDGDYRRQGQQDMLFLRNRSEFDGKFIVATNVDTRGFRDPKGVKGISAQNDLDLWTHVRLYCDSTTNLGITESPGSSKSVGGFVETVNYFANLPEERLINTVAKTKVQWTVAMDNNTGPSYNAATMKMLLDKYGCCCVPINLFEMDIEALKDDYYGKVSYRPKVADVRFVLPKPVELAIPNKQLDARGGYLPIPTTR